MERISKQERRADLQTSEFKEAVQIGLGQVRKEAQQYTRDLCEGVKGELMTKVQHLRDEAYATYEVTPCLSSILNLGCYSPRPHLVASNRWIEGMTAGQPRPNWPRLQGEGAQAQSRCEGAMNEFPRSAEPVGWVEGPSVSQHYQTPKYPKPSSQCS